MQTPKRIILNGCISLTTVRIWNRYSVYHLGINEEYFKLKNKISIFGGKKCVFFLTKNISQISGIYDTSILSFGYSAFLQ